MSQYELTKDHNDHYKHDLGGHLFEAGCLG